MQQSSVDDMHLMHTECKRFAHIGAATHECTVVYGYCHHNASHDCFPAFMCSISPVSPLSEESSGGSKNPRPWEGALFGATPSTAPAPETPPLQASPDLPPPPGLGEPMDFVVHMTPPSCNSPS